MFTSLSVELYYVVGMRLLVDNAASIVVQKINSLLNNDAFSSFLYSSRNTRILSGEEEGIFAWIAVNYLRGAFEGKA